MNFQMAAPSPSASTRTTSFSGSSLDLASHDDIDLDKGQPGSDNYPNQSYNFTGMRLIELAPSSDILLPQTGHYLLQDSLQEEPIEGKRLNYRSIVVAVLFVAAELFLVSSTIALLITPFSVISALPIAASIALLCAFVLWQKNSRSGTAGDNSEQNAQESLRSLSPEWDQSYDKKKHYYNESPSATSKWLTLTE